MPKSEHWMQQIQSYVHDSQIIPNNSAGIHSLHLKLTKCQLAGSFHERCEHAACGLPL